MRLSLRIAAHLCIGLVAFFSLFKTGGKSGIDQSEAASVPSTRASEPRRATDGAGRLNRGMTPAEYQAAWDAIPTRKWGRKERFDWQIKLLKEWAAKDLEGALRAAFSESWGRNQVGLVKDEAFKFHGAFIESIETRPREVLKLIQEKKLGVLESSLLLQAWSVSLFQHDPKVYFSHLQELKGGDFPMALNASFVHAEDINTLTRVFDLAEEKARQGVSMEGLKTWHVTGFAGDFTPEELIERVNIPDRILQDYYVSTMAFGLLKSSYLSKAEDVSAKIQEVPSGTRDQFAGLLLTFASKPGVLQASVDHFVSEGNWAHLEKVDVSRFIQQMAEKSDPAGVAEWAATLPPRQETDGMFRSGVEPFIRKSPEDAWNWIQDMNEGYWRDRALAEYSHVNLTVFNDPAKSAVALAQIRDPDVLNAAQNRTKGWEEGQGN